MAKRGLASFLLPSAAPVGVSASCSSEGRSLTEAAVLRAGVRGRVKLIPLPSVPTPLQNIIKKVSGQKFVYKFVTYPDPAATETVREESRRRESLADAPHLPRGPGGEGAPSLPKGLQLQRLAASPGSAQRSSRNDYMKSGLYSTFTIQSLQAPSKAARPPKAEAPPPAEPSQKALAADRPLPEVRVQVAERSGCVEGAGLEEPLTLQVIVTQPSPSATPALSPQMAPGPAEVSTISQPPKAPRLGDPPRIYLTGVSDPAALTPGAPLAPAAPPVAPSDCEGPPNHQVIVVIKQPPLGAKEPGLPCEEDLMDIVGLGDKSAEEVPAEPVPVPGDLELTASAVEAPLSPGDFASQAGGEGACRVKTELPEGAPSPAGSPEAPPPKAKKPKGLELPSSPTVLPGGLSADKVSAAVNSLLAPGSASNSLTPTVITSHALTPVLLTPSPLPSTIHFWSTLSPIAPRSPAKLSFQFPSNGSSQIHIPALSVDGLSTPVVLSPGPQKP
ncbi:ELK1 protein, partial [Atractosteus spatula]|nr:ELK1 protein [Atractosteus spatula]